MAAGKLIRFFKQSPSLVRLVQAAKRSVRRTFALRYFTYDIGNTFRAMRWEPQDRQQARLSAELLFYYHKLEKGLVMPGPRRMFGVEPAAKVMVLVRQWQAAGLTTADAIYLGALDTLAAYKNHVAALKLDPDGKFLQRVSRFIDEHAAVSEHPATPMKLPLLGQPEADDFRPDFLSLATARRSVRGFRAEHIAPETIRYAVACAQLSPSACNRQPCRLHLVTEPKLRAATLALQNGNRGFGVDAPHVAVITSDERCFFDASERHEPYIDGGLFAMSFILALRSRGVGSCCLNWCVPPANDKAVHALLGIPWQERIVMMVVFGHPVPDCEVPRSPRRDLSDVLVVH